MRSVFTDSHAHLEIVAQRLGLPAVEDVVAAYAMQSEELVLDIGVDPGDLYRRRALVEKSIAIKTEMPGTSSTSATELPIRWAAGIWPGREALENAKAAIDALERDIDSGSTLSANAVLITIIWRARLRRRGRSSAPKSSSP